MRRGNTTLYTYDAKGRVSEKTQYAEGGSARYKTVYTYYDNDLVKEQFDYKLKSSAWSLYHYTYSTYDGLKRLKTEAEVNGDSVPADLSPYTVTYTYDLKDRITDISYGSAAGSEVDGILYSYSGSRLTHVYVKIGAASYLAKEYSYDSAGRVATVKDYYQGWLV